MSRIPVPSEPLTTTAMGLVFNVLAWTCCATTWGADSLPSSPPIAVRIVAAKSFTPGTEHLLRVEALLPGQTNWKLADPDLFTASVEGDAELKSDRAGLPTNPLTLLPTAENRGTASVRIRYADVTHEVRLQIAPQAPYGTLRLAFDVDDPTRQGHSIDGLGAGGLFWEEEPAGSAEDEIFRWCFADVKTRYLRILIRPDLERANDNDDWLDINAAGFDFRSCDRLLKIVREAQRLNPDLQIYACLSSPPSWMTTGSETGGKDGLQPGVEYRRELAEYLWAFLQYAASQQVNVDYLGLFNEPDRPEGEEGLHVPHAGELCDLFAATSEALDRLASANANQARIEAPRWVFPNASGAGAITRTADNRAAYEKHQETLRQRVAVWGVHDYWNSSDYWPTRFQELRGFGPVGDKPIWMTQWGEEERRGDLASANAYSVKVLNALRLGAQAWLASSWCHPKGTQAGLISTDLDAKSPRPRFWRSKSYYAFQQIANTTLPGSVVIQPVSVNLSERDAATCMGSVLEYLAVRNGDQLTVHVANGSSEPMRYDLRWQTLGALSANDRVGGRVTGPLSNNESLPSEPLAQHGGKGRVRGIAPANSLITRTLPLGK